MLPGLGTGQWGARAGAGCCLLLCCSRGHPKAAVDKLTVGFNYCMNVGDAEPKGAVTWAPGTQPSQSDSHGLFAMAEGSRDTG